jgi:hypothetical protein
MAQKRITRDDLEAQFRQLQENVQRSVDDKKSAILSAGVVGTFLVLTIVFLLGRRRGRRKTTMVEIRRI